MAELGATTANATGFISSSSASTRLNEVGKLFGQFFVLLFAIIGIAAMNTSDGKSLLMMALVFAVFLYYLVLVLVTMLELHIKNFLPFVMVILLLGSVVSILALMIISPMVGWIYLGLWIFIFALMCYGNRKELYQMIPKRIKKFIYKGQNGNDNGISTHNSEIPGVESLPV